MSIRTELENALHEAMRQKDGIKRDTIRLALTAIKLAEVEAGKSLDDIGILSVLQKEMKIRKETVNELAGSNRDDLIKKAQSEIDVLEKFLPQQISETDLDKFVVAALESTSAQSMADMGKVMGILVPKLAGQATPDRISQAVRKHLAK